MNGEIPANIVKAKEKETQYRIAEVPTLSLPTELPRFETETSKPRNLPWTLYLLQINLSIAEWSCYCVNQWKNIGNNYVEFAI